MTLRDTRFLFHWMNGEPASRTFSPGAVVSLPHSLLLPPVGTNDPFIGTGGNDHRSGTNNADTFDMTQGGNDIVRGNGGDDTITFGNTFTVDDAVRGGTGTDTLEISGDSYSDGLTITGGMLNGVEVIDLGDNHSYELTFAAHALDDVDRLFVSSQQGTGVHVVLDASAVNKDTILTGTTGDDTLSGGSAHDELESGQSGADTMHGNGGDDILAWSADFDSDDRADGGSGFDTLSLDGNYSFGLTFTANMMVGIEKLSVGTGDNYDITLIDANVGAGKNFLIDGSLNDSAHGGSVDGSAETNGHFTFFGGDGNDAFIGGAKSDYFNGGRGADRLTGGQGGDTFFYSHTNESSGKKFDTIVGFNTKADNIGMQESVFDVDPTIVGGQLRVKHFDDDIGTAVNGHLGDHHAILFMPDSGTYAGAIFLIIEQAGQANYVSGEDIVVRLDAPQHLSDLSTANFTV